MRRKASKFVPHHVGGGSQNLCQKDTDILKNGWSIFLSTRKKLKVFVLFHVNLNVLNIEFKGNECSQFALWAPLASNGGAGSASTMVMVARA